MISNEERREVARKMSTGIAAQAFAKMLRDQPVTDMHREDCRGCGECCGRFLPLTPADEIRLAAYVRSHGIKPHPEPRSIVDLTCPYLNGKRECMVYEARPEICRGYSCSKHASGELLVDAQLLKSLSAAVDIDMRLFAEAI